MKGYKLANQDKENFKGNNRDLCDQNMIKKLKGE
jgi:hypothetical protein